MCSFSLHPLWKESYLLTSKHQYLFITVIADNHDIIYKLFNNIKVQRNCFHVVKPGKNLFLLGPLSVDFGEVCVQSVCVQKLKVINHLSVFVWVQLEVDCPELQGSSPLSHILPPHSHNTLPLTFQSNKLGHFYRLVGEAAQHTCMYLHVNQLLQF